MAPDEARRTALLEFGNPVRHLEDSRAVWLIPWLVSVGQDVRYVLRTIRRQPVFSASVVLILTLGIGLVTALFTAFTAAVLRPWPVPESSAIVVINPRPASNEQYGTLSSLEYRYFREHARSFSHLAASLGGGGPVGRTDGTMFATLQSQYVTANYFDALRVGMTIGRGFLPEEEDYLSPKAVAVISERVWREYFASDAGVLGSPIRIGDKTVTVVGVAARGFAGVRGSIRDDLWLPLPTVATGAGSAAWRRKFDDPRESFSSRVFGRMRPGVTAEEALAELNVLNRQFRSAHAMEAPGLRVADTRPLSADNEIVRVWPARPGADVSRAPAGDAARLRQRRQSRPREDRGAAGRDRHQALARREPLARGAPAHHRSPGPLARGRPGCALPRGHSALAVDPAERKRHPKRCTPRAGCARVPLHAGDVHGGLRRRQRGSSPACHARHRDWQR